MERHFVIGESALQTMRMHADEASRLATQLTGPVVAVVLGHIEHLRQEIAAIETPGYCPGSNDELGEDTEVVTVPDEEATTRRRRPTMPMRPLDREPAI